MSSVREVTDLRAEKLTGLPQLKINTIGVVLRIKKAATLPDFTSIRKQPVEPVALLDN
jgi:hypothetical protein